MPQSSIWCRLNRDDVPVRQLPRRRAAAARRHRHRDLGLSRRHARPAGGADRRSRRGARGAGARAPLSRVDARARRRPPAPGSPPPERPFKSRRPCIGEPAAALEADPGARPDEPGAPRLGPEVSAPAAAPPPWTVPGAPVRRPRRRAGRAGIAGRAGARSRAAHRRALGDVGRHRRASSSPSASS